MLESITDRENVISYSYNKDGIRIGKTVNGIDIEYLLDENNQMAGEKCGEEILWYLYDSGNEISGFEWNGIDYYYVKNATGDVQGITDKAGNVLCTYYYDVWGKLTGITGDEELGRRNPIRYRGYYYDEETGLYYLNTRYYDPEVKRFLNRDMLDNETNLYQYCYNNPVMHLDCMGLSSTDVVDSWLSVVTTAYGYNLYYVLNTYHTYQRTYNRDCQTIYFNCYLWSIGKTSDENLHNGKPGQYTSVKTSVDTLENVKYAAICDLIALKYTIYSSTTYYPAIRSGAKVIAVRMQKNTGGDYHFMKLDSVSSGTWSFKAGWGGCVFRLSSGLKPNNVMWYSYEYKENMWKHDVITYNSTIWYIAYK